MKYAVVKIGGRQYKVAEKDEVVLDRLPQEEKKKVNFSEVLLVVNGKKVKIGQPYVKGAGAAAVVLAHFKGEKIRVATYKAKSRYRRVKGFRPQLTKIKIESITTP